MDKPIRTPGSITKITSDQTFEPGIESHPATTAPAQSSYVAKIITPADSLLVAAAERASRASSGRMASGSNFGERVSQLGASISHLIADITHTISERAHETIGMISSAAHNLTETVTHAAYHGMVEETRREIRAHPKRDLVLAAGIGMTLGLLVSMRRMRR